MNSAIKTLGIMLCALVLSGCPEPTRNQATVKLTIDGKSFDYTTSHAQWDQQEEGGQYSIYLLPADLESGAPYVCLRTYVGNPVAQLWVRYTKPSAKSGGDDQALNKYECFVPGTLDDGRATLGWKKSDGKKRHRNETGDPSCTASLTRKDDKLHLTFDAELPLFVKKKKGKVKGEKEVVDVIKAAGSAELDPTPVR
ncbi:MAG: hypothetical protein JRI68_24780 [Deltaproteobacteria bacterium]|nr:hypothetical protein [Deltaproteobacteria bacterium]